LSASAYLDPLFCAGYGRFYPAAIVGQKSPCTRGIAHRLGAYELRADFETLAHRVQFSGGELQRKHALLWTFG